MIQTYILRRCGFTLGLLALASAAPAQESASRLRNNRGAVGTSVSRLDQNSALRATNAFAKCVAQREARSTRRALDLPFTSTEQNVAMQKTREQFEGCLGYSDDYDELRAGRVLMTGGAAEYFVLSDLRSVDLSPVAGMTDEALSKTKFKPRTGLEDLGICIVRRDPQRARSLLKTLVTSDAELAVFRAMVADIGACVDAGNKLTLNRANIRAVVAYAMYRISSQMGATGA